MATKGYEVFVAYSGIDEDLKNVVVSALAEQMKLKTNRAISEKIFAFSDASSHADWLERNTRAVTEASVAVVLLTPNSIYSPWIHYEIGVNRSKNGQIIVVGLAKGLGPEDFPLDVADFYKAFRTDFIEIDTTKGVSRLLKSTSDALGTRITCKPSTLASIVRVAKGIGGWGVTSQCAHATRIGTCPFTFMAHIEASTTRQIVDFGQNLNFLFGEGTDAVKRRKTLLKQLRKKGGPTVWIIICDKDYPAFTQSWCDLMGSSYEGHLDNATKNLVKFWQRYVDYCKKNRKQRRMKVYVVKVMPSSFTFVNPEKKDGFLFVKPQIAGEPTTRPIFCLTAANPYHNDAIGYYWGYLLQLLRTKDFAKELALVKGKTVLRPVISKRSRTASQIAPPPSCNLR